MLVPDRIKRSWFELVTQPEQCVDCPCNHGRMMQALCQGICLLGVVDGGSRVILDEHTGADDVGIAMIDLCAEEWLTCAIGLLGGLAKGVDDMRQQLIGV